MTRVVPPLVFASLRPIVFVHALNGDPAEGDVPRHCLERAAFRVGSELGGGMIPPEELPGWFAYPRQYYMAVNDADGPTDGSEYVRAFPESVELIPNPSQIVANYLLQKPRTVNLANPVEVAVNGQDHVESELFRASLEQLALDNPPGGDGSFGGRLADLWG